MANGNGWNVNTLTALAGFLLAVIGPLIGIIYWRQRADISGLRAEVKKLWVEVIEFHEHKAFDTERQKHWESWRAERDRSREELLMRVTALENRIVELRTESLDWRHKVLQPRLSELQVDIIRIKDKLGVGT